MSNCPLVSIIIPFYNCAYVQHAIESALDQSYPNVEVIVVNDGSTRHTEKISPYFDRIIYLAKPNGGTGSALNAGIAHASGQYFTWLSSDDRYDRDKVAKQVDYMRKHDAMVCYSAYYFIDSNHNQIGGKVGISYPNKLQFCKTMQKGCFINGCTVMLHMNVLKEVGVFNEALKYTQDYDLWMRILQKHVFHYLDEPLVFYRVHEEMGTKKFGPSITKEIYKVQQTYRRKLDEMIRNETLKITFPILTLSIGGAQRMLAEIVNGMVARGHEVTVLMPTEGVLDYPVHARIVRTQSKYLIQAQDYPQGDIIISNYFTLVPGAEQASKEGKGVHIRLSLCYEPTFLPDNSVTFPTYHVTRNLLVLSNWQQQIMKLNHGIQAHIVPVGVSPAFKNMHIRKPEGPLQISAILRRTEGGYSWHREQNYLIHELQQVKSRYPDVQINLFTPPYEFATSPSLHAIKSNNPFRYLTPGNDQEMCYHYNETDIFVNSSTYDTASLPGLEAMKCGAALVTTYAGGNLDYCRHEENGLMSYRYENRLAKDVIRLIENPELRRSLAAAGEEEAVKWTWERSTDAFERAVQSIVTTV